jgi:hypothetical protein
MLLLVVVYKVGNGIVVAAGEHAAWGFFFLDYKSKEVSLYNIYSLETRRTLFGIGGLLVGVGGIASLNGSQFCQ